MVGADDGIRRSRRADRSPAESIRRHPIPAFDVHSVADAIYFGLVVSTSYLTAMTSQIPINPNVPRPLLYGAIRAPFIGTCVLNILILVTMR